MKKEADVLVVDFKARKLVEVKPGYRYATAPKRSYSETTETLLECGYNAATAVQRLLEFVEEMGVNDLGARDNLTAYQQRQLVYIAKVMGSIALDCGDQAEYIFELLDENDNEDGPSPA
nr:hypothetical protein BdHM001_35850 [Bdellovibrio sp. HM001]